MIAIGEVSFIWVKLEFGEMGDFSHIAPLATLWLLYGNGVDFITSILFLSRFAPCSSLSLSLSLLMCFANWLPEQRIGEEWHDYQCIGDIIVHHAPFMRMYSVYCDKFERFVAFKPTIYFFVGNCLSIFFFFFFFFSWQLVVARVASFKRLLTVFTFVFFCLFFWGIVTACNNTFRVVWSSFRCSGNGWKE
jgi:hypothetical protein